MNWHRWLGLFVVTLTSSIAGRASAELLLYEPFNYTAGENLGGKDDPDGAGAVPGTPIGQTNLNTGGGSWYARGSNAGTPAEPVNNYQSPKDTLITSGSLSYSGLAVGVGNSVSYGSTTPASTTDPYYADVLTLPASVSSGALYASFIIRIKSPQISNATGIRHAPAGFVTDFSNEALSGTKLTVQESSSFLYPGSFWMRRDPTNINLSNFSPGKSSSDGMGPGSPPASNGPSAGWQHSQSVNPTTMLPNIESNQVGAVNGQPLVNAADSNTFQTYFVVMKYAFGAQTPDGAHSSQADNVSMWMNPGSGTLGTPTGEAAASQAATGNLGSYYATLNSFGAATTDAGVINSFALVGYLRTTNATIAVDFDELRIGTTWADVTPAATFTPTGDFDGDGDADGTDFLTWQSNYSLTPASLAQGDANGNGAVNDADFGIWKSEFGRTDLATPAMSTVPEPATLLPAMLVAAGLGIVRPRTRADSLFLDA